MTSHNLPFLYYKYTINNYFLHNYNAILDSHNYMKHVVVTVKDYYIIIYPQ